MKQRRFVVTVKNASSGIPFMAKYQDAEKMLTDIMKWTSIRWDMCKSRVALFDTNGVLLYATVVV